MGAPLTHILYGIQVIPMNAFIADYKLEYTPRILLRSKDQMQS